MLERPTHCRVLIWLSESKSPDVDIVVPVVGDNTLRSHVIQVMQYYHLSVAPHVRVQRLNAQGQVFGDLFFRNLVVPI